MKTKIVIAVLLIILFWVLGYHSLVIGLLLLGIVSIIILFLLRKGFGSSNGYSNEKPNIIKNNVTSVYIEPIWSYVVSGVIVLIVSFLIYLCVFNLAYWVFMNVFEIISISNSEKYAEYIATGAWILTALSGLNVLYDKSNKLSIKTGDCGVITFLGDRISPVSETIFYLGEGNHWTIPQLINHIPVTITKHKIEFKVDDELSSDNVKMKMKGFLLYGIRIANNYAAYKEEIDAILINLCISASRMGLRSISMTEGVGTVSPVSDRKEAFQTVKKMMAAISKNRKKAADLLKKKLFEELQKISEDIDDTNQDEIVSEKLGINILKKDLNILEVIPTSDGLLKQMEQFVGEMFQRIGEYLDLETFNEMCKELKLAMPNLTDQEIAEIIQRNQGKFKNVETIFRGFEGATGGGKMDPATAAIIAEVLKKMKK
jgi:hypothetical protein